jgi:hypothetical protein
MENAASLKNAPTHLSRGDDDKWQSPLQERHPAANLQTN